ncbi:MAG: M48 family metallopeptidase [Opitutaceae bacterium]
MVAELAGIMASPVFQAAAVLILARLAASLTLSALNRGEVRRHAEAPPAAAGAIMDPPTYRRSVDYTLTKSRFGAAAETYEAALLIAALASGVLPRLGAWFAGSGAPGAAWTGAAFILAVFLLLGLCSLPFELWEEFRIERRFGFSRMGPGLWFADQLKHAALTIAIGYPLLWVLLTLVRRMGPAWWAWAAAFVFAVQLAMLLVYPRLILPLFNHLAPLPEGELRSRLVALGERTGFRAGAIEVMDGSRRSGHSNAYFTGFGRFRRIVLYDTLVGQLAPEELEAVLAHEIGHYRCGHIPRMLVLSAAGLAAGFAIVAALFRAPWFAAGFGFPPRSLAPAFLLCGLLAGAATFWLTPLFGALSRRYEYQADAFARRAMAGPDALVSALRRLAERNLSNLTPHPAFSAFHYSHPTLVERERALRRGATNGRSRPSPAP